MLPTMFPSVFPPGTQLRRTHFHMCLCPELASEQESLLGDVFAVTCRTRSGFPFCLVLEQLLHERAYLGHVDGLPAFEGLGGGLGGRGGGMICEGSTEGEHVSSWTVPCSPHSWVWR